MQIYLAHEGVQHKTSTETKAHDSADIFGIICVVLVSTIAVVLVTRWLSKSHTKADKEEVS